MAAKITPPDERPGVKTTEFWLTIVAQVVGVLAGYQLGGNVGTVVMVASAVLVSLGYTAARAKTKAATAKKKG